MYHLRIVPKIFPATYVASILKLSQIWLNTRRHTKRIDKS